MDINLFQKTAKPKNIENLRILKEMWTTLFASAIPYGNDEAKAHLFSSPPSSPPSPPSSSPVCQMEILANWNSQISQDLD